MLIYSFGKSGYTSKFNSPFLLSEEYYRNDEYFNEFIPSSQSLLIDSLQFLFPKC